MPTNLTVLLCCPNPKDHRNGWNSTQSSKVPYRIGRANHDQIEGRFHEAINPPENIGSIISGTAFLRFALGVGFLSAVASRLGFWGPPGDLPGFVGQLSQFPALHRQSQSLVPGGLSSTAWSGGDDRRGWTGDSPDTRLLNSVGRAVDWDDHPGIRCGNDFGARSLLAAELLGLRILGSIVSTCIAGARQAEHRHLAGIEGSAPGASIDVETPGAIKQIGIRGSSAA